MKKIFCILILVFCILFPSFAEESFYQTIINASYLGDFAYGTFPLSLWADFGVSGIQFIPGVSTKVYARVEAGLTERGLKQYPSTGDIIPVDQTGGSYSVAFSDGSIVLEQGVLADEERPGHDQVSISVSLRMRWEQAFATFDDIRNENGNGIFGNDALFPVVDGFYLGTPELSGNRYFLSNSFGVSATYDKYYSDYLAPNGFKMTTNMVFAPFWLANDLELFDGAKTDAYRIRLSGQYDYTFFDKKSRSGKNLYSMYVTANTSMTFLFGSAIPRYMQDKSFIGKSIVPRLFYWDLYGKLQFNGPEFLTLGTYPAVYVFMQQGLNAGKVINSNSSVSAEFYGGVGVGAQLTLIGYLRAFVEYAYIYTPIMGEEVGHKFNMGCYFTMIF